MNPIVSTIVIILAFVFLIIFLFIGLICSVGASGTGALFASSEEFEQINWASWS